jgi:hypothetical protein
LRASLHSARLSEQKAKRIFSGLCFLGGFCLGVCEWLRRVEGWRS